MGIPLCDELKSSAGQVESPDGSIRTVVVHCRGHQQVDYDKVSRLLGGTFSRLPAEELPSRLGATYGTVSPVMMAGYRDVEQLVDFTVVKEYFPPHTMMTNLGDFQTAVEFVPSELFGKLPRVSFADVVFDEFHGEPKFRAIGILTGNSPEAGILLWRTINSEIRSQPRLHVRGDFDFPRIVIESIPEMGLSMELVARGREVRPVVLSAVRRLCKAGVDVVALACNTTQYYASEIRGICSEYSVEFVSMVETTAARLIREGVESFDLLATALVSGSSEWSDFASLREEFNVHIPSERDLTAITELAFSVKREVITAGSVNRLRDLIASSTINETVVVALTELSILLESQRSRQRSRRRYIDTLTVLGEVLAARYCAERISFGAA